MIRIYVVIGLIIALLASFWAWGSYKERRGYNLANVEQYQAIIKAKDTQLAEYEKDTLAISNKNNQLINQLKELEKKRNDVQRKINNTSYSNYINNSMLTAEFVRDWNNAIYNNQTENTGADSIYAREPSSITANHALEQVNIYATMYYNCVAKVEAWQHWYYQISE